jgi:hypothetical protein
MAEPPAVKESADEKDQPEAKEPSLETQLTASRLQVEDFLKMHTAYDLLPESGKVVVIDIGLSISSAFQALAENGLT